MKTRNEWETTLTSMLMMQQGFQYWNGRGMIQQNLLARLPPNQAPSPSKKEQIKIFFIKAPEKSLIP